MSDPTSDITASRDILGTPWEPIPKKAPVPWPCEEIVAILSRCAKEKSPDVFCTFVEKSAKHLCPGSRRVT